MTGSSRWWYDVRVSLEAFGVKNLRCLTDTGLVPIRPITVLVGKNSSGKSTFLRAFPLLRQSVQTNRNSPILWYSDDHPVDFGSLREAASAWLDEPSVTFDFGLRLPEDRLLFNEEIECQFGVTIVGDEIPYVNDYLIQAKGHRIECSFDPKGRMQRFSINGRRVALDAPLSLGGRPRLLPSLWAQGTSGVIYSSAPETSTTGNPGLSSDSDEVLLPPVRRAVKELFDGDLGALAILSEVMLLQSEAEMLKDVAQTARNARLRKNASANINEWEIVFRGVARLVPYLIQAADFTVSRFMSRVAYLAPLRVSAQRAYRVTNLAVDEVDPDGKNLAMFLRSLTGDEAQSFASFTHEAMGFETKVRTTGMHAEILVRQGESERFLNLIDVGFGYSEVLPLAAVLWTSCLRPLLQGREPAPLVAVEQPELHLHPAHQAKLARMLVAAVTKGKGSRILVETHSESLINGLGKLVYEGEIRAEDIQIVLFDQDAETERTTVRLAGYREDGALRDWPYGFLSPVAERRAHRTAAE